jgi:hypothetical protein
VTLTTPGVVCTTALTTVPDPTTVGETDAARICGIAAATAPSAIRLAVFTNGRAVLRGASGGTVVRMCACCAFGGRLRVAGVTAVVAVAPVGCEPVPEESAPCAHAVRLSAVLSAAASGVRRMRASEARE